MVDPKYSSAKRMGRWLPKQKYKSFWESKSMDLLLPRGSLTKLKAFYSKNKIKVVIKDQTKIKKPLNLKFYGKLKKEKGQLAIKKFRNNYGILNAPTGTGKTVMGCWRIADLNQPTIIVVHTKRLMKQWEQELKKFLKVDVGIIGGGIIDVYPVTIASMQTLIDNLHLLKSFGFMVIDECHRSSCETYMKIIDNYYGRYLMGLTATAKRTDGLTRPMKWHVGGVHVSIGLDKADLCPCNYKIITTGYKNKKDLSKEYSKSIVNLARNKPRNELIIKTITENIELPGIHLVISQNRNHCTKLYKMLPKHLRLISDILTSKVKDKIQDKIVNKMSEDKLKIIFATDKLIGEGFDEPLLSVLHLTTPIKSDVRLIQYVGRIRRKFKGKKSALVFDYFDPFDKVFRKAIIERIKTYKKNDIKEVR